MPRKSDFFLGFATIRIDTSAGLFTTREEKRSSKWCSLQKMPIHSPKVSEHQRPFVFNSLHECCLLSKKKSYLKKKSWKEIIFMSLWVLWRPFRLRSSDNSVADLIPNKAFHNQILLVCLKKVEWCLTEKTRTKFTKFGYFIKAMCVFVYVLFCLVL